MIRFNLQEHNDKIFYQRQAEQLDKYAKKQEYIIQFKNGGVVSSIFWLLKTKRTRTVRDNSSHQKKLTIDVANSKINIFSQLL